MTVPNNDRLLTSLREAARSMTDNRSVRDVDVALAQLVRAAADTVPGAVGGGVSRTEGTNVRSSHATHDEIRGLDQLQSQLGQGPCITAADDPPETGVVLADDLAGTAGERWPRFAPAAVDRGFRSILSVQLSADRGHRSALNLYARDPFVFDAGAQLTAGLFAIQASMLLHGADTATQLGQALETRDVIGQAKGILMERFSVDDTRAFDMLVRSSQDTNMKLVSVAQWLTSQSAGRGESTEATTSS